MGWAARIRKSRQVKTDDGKVKISYTDAKTLKEDISEERRLEKLGLVQAGNKLVVVR